MRIPLQSLKYENHKLNICANSTVVSLLTGLHSGFTKCFCYYANGTAEPHYVMKEWPLRAHIVSDLETIAE